MQENAQRVLRILKERKINNEQTEKLVKLLDRPGNLKDADIKPIIEQLKNTYKDSELEFILDRFESSVVVVEAVRNKIPHNVLNAKNHEKEAYIVAQAGRFGTITIATNMAGRGTDIILGGNPEYLTAEAVMKFKLDQNSQEYKDKWKELFRKFKDECEQEHEKVVELGGLHIIGTERHESRRIDNQLRGRAARQGDPGSTKFFLSLEDNLMRIFGGEKISQIMTFLKAEEDLPIEAKMVTTAVEGAQKRVEAHNFDLRKHVLQYDDVMNTQREVIYRERRRILEGADITDSILEMIDIHMQNILYAHINPETPSESWQDEALPNLYKALRADFPVLNNTVTIESLNSGSFNELKEILNQAGLDAYSIKQKDLGPENIKEIERQIMLHVIDSKWVDHLHNMDALRDGIHLRGYGQKDPLMEYKKEAFDMFEQLLIDVKREAVVLLMHAQIEAVEGNSEQGEENQEDEEIRV